ncbi:hypothetical protein PIB30_078508 [Stylosanthes scabra]|uniref:Myb-like domain-containing protein n=1 Tax=Stylosanthes scabra TaxID=79078 RepID=A0ABU6XP86_9FABA|nr:hypothetical protein [Stylosanthes scabra]
MGYKRCLPANGFDSSISRAKRFECSSELISFTDVDTPNSAFVKPVISGEDEVGFYNIQWYDAAETDISFLDAKTSGHFSSNSSEDDAICSGMTSVSSGSSDYLDDVYSTPDHSPRKPVPIGPNHQANIPEWQGRISEASEFADDSTSHDLVSLYTIDDVERRLMGTSVLPMPNTDFHSSKDKRFGEARTECNCIDQGSVRCVQMHIREARKVLLKSIGNENFVNLGFYDMGEDVALKWSEEEEEVFHEVVYTNLASSGRNFWEHLSLALPTRTRQEIISYYFNVFMLRRRAMQNRSKFLEIDSDDDEECHTNNAGFKVSKDDTAMESLEEQGVHAKNQDKYYDEDDSDDDNTVCGTPDDTANTSEEVGGISSHHKSCGTSFRHVGWTSDDFLGQDDSCLSFEYQTNMVHDGEFKCDQSQQMVSNLEFSSHIMEHAYLLEPCDDAKDWYSGYSLGPATDIDLLPTSNLIEEIFSNNTPDRKTRSD